MTKRSVPPRGRMRLVLWARAFAGFYRPDAEGLAGLDQVSRFLYAARSVILVISAQAAVIAGLLAATEHAFRILPFAMVLLGFVTLHMISNLSNDYFGYRRGHDTPDSPRLRYTVHPLAGGALDQRTLVTGILILAAIAAGIMAFFVAVRGWPAVGFAVAGLALLFLYDASPIPLKAIGLGEAAAFVVWGPLMVGGGCAMISGRISAAPFLAAVPYGLGVASILVGKHLDQLDFDAGRGNRTLPVLMGERRARALNRVVVAAMYATTVALILHGVLEPFSAVVAVAVPSAVRAQSLMRQPRPSSPPPGYVGWPLWYHRACLVHNRLFGWLYVLGLAAGVALPVARL